MRQNGTTIPQRGEDRRARRSKALLMEALVALLLQHSYTDITIRDITAHADVGYMTFYRHFESKDDLLAKVIQARLRDALADISDDCHQIGRLVFRYAAANEALIGLMLFHPAAGSARYAVQEQLAAHLSALSVPFGEASDIPRAVAVTHIAASILNLIAWWLKQRKPYTIEQMGAMYQNMILAPLIPHPDRS